MSQADIEQIELSIEHANALVEKGRLAEKLAKNKDFRKLILEDYFVEEAARLVLLFSDPAPEITPAVREAIKNDILAIGGLKRFLSAKVRMGHIAHRELGDFRETLEELRDEDDEGIQGEFEDLN